MEVDVLYRLTAILAYVGDDSVTVTKLPVGSYTVTELTDLSCRYENAEAERKVDLIYSDSNEIIFDNSRENGKWLDGNTTKIYKKVTKY